MNNKISYNFLKVALLSSLFLFLSSCDFVDDVKVCKVGENVLYEAQLKTIQNLFYDHLNYEESRELAIHQWVTQQQVNLEIQEQQPGTKERNEVQVQDNLMQLHLFELENEYIKTHLDSLISEKEIQEFYLLHRNDYKTQSYIVKALYLQIPDTVAEKLNVEKFYLLKNDKDIREIEKIGNLYATNFYYEKDAWIYFDDLIRGVPMVKEDKEHLIKTKGNIALYIEGEAYFINIFDFKTKTVDAPLESEKELIKNDILKQKVSQLRKKAKEIILKEIDEKYPVTYF